MKPAATLGKFNINKIVNPNLKHLDLRGQVTFDSTRALGFGASSEIFKGFISSSGKKVAVKRLRFHVDAHDWDQVFERETYIWAKLNHENVLPLLGYDFCPDTGFCLMISEWMNEGSVWRYIHGHGSLSTLDVGSLICDIAHGLAYLHRENVIHEDLKADNVVVSPTRRAMICDFGSARMAVASRSIAGITSSVTGTLLFWAPELVPSSKAPAKHSKETDVWAFGMTTYEILYRRRPFEDMQQLQVMQCILDGKLPALNVVPWKRIAGDEGLVRELKSVCQNCWSMDPRSRPLMDTIIGSGSLSSPLLFSNSRSDAIDVSSSPCSTFDIPVILPAFPQPMPSWLVQNTNDDIEKGSWVDTEVNVSEALLQSFHPMVDVPFSRQQTPENHMPEPDDILDGALSEIPVATSIETGPTTEMEHAPSVQLPIINNSIEPQLLSALEEIKYMRQMQWHHMAQMYRAPAPQRRQRPIIIQTMPQSPMPSSTTTRKPARPKKIPIPKKNPTPAPTVSASRSEKSSASRSGAPIPKKISTSTVPAAQPGNISASIPVPRKQTRSKKASVPKIIPTMTAPVSQTENHSVLNTARRKQARSKKPPVPVKIPTSQPEKSSSRLKAGTSGQTKGGVESSKSAVPGSLTSPALKKPVPKPASMSQNGINSQKGPSNQKSSIPNQSQQNRLPSSKNQNPHNQQQSASAGNKNKTVQKTAAAVASPPAKPSGQGGRGGTNTVTSNAQKQKSAKRPAGSAQARRR